MNYQEKHEYVIINGKKHKVIHPKKSYKHEEKRERFKEFASNKIRNHNQRDYDKDTDISRIKFKLGGGI